MTTPQDRMDAASAMRRAQRLMRLFRSNIKEGFPQHALWYLIDASREVGEAMQIACSGCAVTSRTLEHGRNRLMDYFKVPHAPNPFDRY